MTHTQANEPGFVLVPAEFLDFLKHAPVSSGVCCCGDEIDKHSDPMSAGHSPVDMWDHVLEGWLKQIAAEANPAPTTVEVAEVEVAAAYMYRHADKYRAPELSFDRFEGASAKGWTETPLYARPVEEPGELGACEVNPLARYWFGSSRRWQAKCEAMEADHARHGRLVNAIIDADPDFDFEAAPEDMADLAIRSVERMMRERDEARHDRAIFEQCSKEGERLFKKSEAALAGVAKALQHSSFALDEALTVINPKTDEVTYARIQATAERARAVLTGDTQESSAEGPGEAVSIYNIVSAIDEGRLWECGEDPDGYATSVQHVAAHIAKLFAGTISRRDRAADERFEMLVTAAGERDTALADLERLRERLGTLLAATNKARTALAGFTSVEDAAFALDVAIGGIADWKRRAALSSQESSAALAGGKEAGR